MSGATDKQREGFNGDQCQRKTKQLREKRLGKAQKLQNEELVFS